MKPSWETYFLNLAQVISTRATCPRKRVGCVLVRDNRILATGYNGSQSGAPECDEVGCLVESNHCQRTIHDSENALLTAAKFGISVDGSILYATHKPCARCEMRLKQAGIQKMFWTQE